MIYFPINLGEHLTVSAKIVFLGDTVGAGRKPAVLNCVVAHACFGESPASIKFYDGWLAAVKGVL